VSPIDACSADERAFSVIMRSDITRTFPSCDRHAAGASRPTRSASPENSGLCFHLATQFDPEPKIRFTDSTVRRCRLFARHAQRHHGPCGKRPQGQPPVTPTCRCIRKQRPRYTASNRAATETVSSGPADIAK
jgi:hypothetical protein